MNEISGSWSDEEIERRIQKKGLNAPRITPQDIEEAIDKTVPVQYHRFPGTTVTICCVSMRNGFNVVGKSAAMSPENFDDEIGKLVAFENAKDQMRPFLGYAFLERRAAEK